MSKQKTGPKLERGIDEVRRHEVSLDPLSVTMLKVVGGGNLSRGVRHAARVAFKDYQNQPDDGPATGAPQAPSSAPGTAP
jgi:hypothetical protein